MINGRPLTVSKPMHTVQCIISYDSVTPMWQQAYCDSKASEEILNLTNALRETNDKILFVNDIELVLTYGPVDLWGPIHSPD